MIKIRTLFISDVHLGTAKCNALALLEVLKIYDMQELIIVGDFIDLTALKNKFYWQADYSTVIQKILRLSRKGVKITYIIGNHDYYLRGLIHESNINLGDIQLCDDLHYTTIQGEKIYICHGDQFDGFVRLHPFLYKLGDFAYEFSFKINKFYNFGRRLLGLPEWSLSAYLKAKVKGAIAFVNNFKILAEKTAIDKNVDAIMIGHIHTPAKEKIGSINYYNTGDFCESCSYIVEDLDGILLLEYAPKLTN